jgi:hypothetical protein
MQSYEKKRFYTFRADANALGGYLEEPFEKIIRTLAPVSLPPVGGFATARSEAFNLDEIVSCSSAYTRVSGREHADGSVSIQVAATVEDLNILDVVTAERIVAQVSIAISNDQKPLRFSLAGSRFVGLWLAGRKSCPKLNSRLQLPGSGTSSQGLTLTYEDVRQTGRDQAARLIKGFQAVSSSAHEWAKERHEWMTLEQPRDDTVLCSLVDGFEGADSTEGCDPVDGFEGAEPKEGDGFEGAEPEERCGHIVEIPGFGRIILGELLISRKSVQLVAIRAELGCSVRGKVGVNAVGGGGSGDN